MDNTIIAAFIGVLGTIIATATGGYCSYKGSEKAYLKQMKAETNERKLEEQRRMDTALTITKTFLLPEIKENYNQIEKGDSAQILRKLLKGESENIGHVLGNFTFKYIDYNTVKYDIIKYNIKEIIDIIEIYQMFTYINLNNDKTYNELSDREKDLLKNGINKCEKLIKNS